MVEFRLQVWQETPQQRAEFSTAIPFLKHNWFSAYSFIAKCHWKFCLRSGGKRLATLHSQQLPSPYFTQFRNVSLKDKKIPSFICYTLILACVRRSPRNSLCCSDSCFNSPMFFLGLVHTLTHTTWSTPRVDPCVSKRSDSHHLCTHTPLCSQFTPRSRLVGG